MIQMQKKECLTFIFGLWWVCPKYQIPSLLSGPSNQVKEPMKPHLEQCPMATYRVDKNKKQTQAQT